MNKEAAFCNIIADENESITNWVCDGLKVGTHWLGEHFTIGFVRKNKLIGGLIYHDYRPGRDVWWTLYTTDKRWCSKRVLRFMCSLAFDHFKCRRIRLMTGVENIKCLKLACQLGFRAEGVLEDYNDDGSDAVIMALCKQQLKF